MVRCELCGIPAATSEPCPSCCATAAAVGQVAVFRAALLAALYEERFPS